MVKQSYKDYLKSRHLRHTRARALRAAHHKCSACGTAESLVVHHRSYDRIGHELLTDLTVFCDSCHLVEHNITHEVREIVNIL